MGKKAPRRGSLAFWHRARARRLVPRMRAWVSQAPAGLAAFVGYKAGMTRVLLIGDSGHPFAGQEVSTPATVIEAPPLFAYAITAYEQTLFGLKKIAEVPVQAAAAQTKHLRKSLTPAKKSGGVQVLDGLLSRATEFRVIACTQPFKTSFGRKAPDCIELPLRGTREQQLEFAKTILGKEVSASQAFKPGEFVDAIAVTKGKGWQGVVKRRGVSLNPRKATKARRHGGAIGAERQAKVFYTVPRAGQHGFHRRTDKNKQIIFLGEKSSELSQKAFHSYGPLQNEFIVVKGSVPGPAKRVVLLRRSLSMRFREPQLKTFLEKVG